MTAIGQFNLSTEMYQIFVDLIQLNSLNLLWYCERGLVHPYDFKNIIGANLYIAKGFVQFLCQNYFVLDMFKVFLIM